MGKQYLTEHAIIFLEKSSGLSWNYPYDDVKHSNLSTHSVTGLFLESGPSLRAVESMTSYTTVQTGGIVYFPCWRMAK